MSENKEETRLRTNLGIDKSESVKLGTDKDKKSKKKKEKGDKDE